MQYEILFPTILALAASLLTLVVKWLFDIITQNFTYKKERRKIYYTRKLKASEDAIGCIVSCLDSFTTLSYAIEYSLKNPYSCIEALYEDIIRKVDALIKDVNERMNPLYLYIDFSEIEDKHNEKRLIRKLISSNDATLYSDPQATYEQIRQSLKQYKNNIDKVICYLEETKGFIINEIRQNDKNCCRFKKKVRSININP